MPKYCYTTESGVTVEQNHSMSSVPKRVRVGDEWGYRDFAAEHGNHATGSGNWPMKSWAAGCNPNQVGEFTKASAERGVPTEFTKDGKAVFTSRGHRKKYLKAFGMHDRNAGYGD